MTSGLELRALARFVPDCAVLLARLARDSRVQRRRKAVLLPLAAYLASPIDLIPDFLPVIGHLDDALVLALALRWLVGGEDEELLRVHWPGPEAGLNVVLRLASAR
jgi:uncharacterized membrane protein YkvA (DUF1232 family)